MTITGINENFYNSDMPLKEGATAYSILSETGLSYKKTGFGSATYVRAINGLAEKDHGPLSGWMYKVNGVAPNISAGSYKLKKGDQVVWYYVNYNYWLTGLTQRQASHFHYYLIGHLVWFKLCL